MSNNQQDNTQIPNKNVTQTTNNNTTGESKLKLINFDLADIYFPLYVI